ncbi:cytochrome C [Algoriphagus aquimarinus]|uniref:cytochrome C n=1 Tax=Algoriphagus aquimarinus TaxID=237018 RepID=UPI0030D9076A|tara:strand:+ start:924 stop:1346 length:423 start_codon:yes stop_codon:yes gene_type:complete
MEDNRRIKIFLDEDTVPFAEFTPPVKFVFDSTKIPDGKHELKIVALSSNGKEGVKHIPFEVRNGPSITVIGLNPNEIVNEQIPITVNAYGSERSDLFIVSGSENPKGIPAWIWALVLSFVGFALFYLIMYLSPDFYKSFV